MMNPYYYLFYKLSELLNKKRNNEWGPIFAITVLVGWNIGIIYGNIFHINTENFKGDYKTGLIIIVIGLFITNSFLFLNKKRCQVIMKRYLSKSRKMEIVGTVSVILYIILTFISLFFCIR